LSGALAFVANYMHLFGKNRLSRVLVTELNAVSLDIFLDDSLDCWVFKCFFQLGIAKFLAQALEQLRLDKHQYPTDFPMG
jgi:hypothetical protein